jgi:hypothetical protein
MGEEAGEHNMGRGISRDVGEGQGFEPSTWISNVRF